MHKYVVGTTRENIVRAAINVFSDTDFHKAGMREVAKQAGVSPRCVYKYFPSKEQLLVSVANEKLGRMVIELKQHLSGVRGTLNKLNKMTTYYLSTYEDDRQNAWLLLVTTNLTIWQRSPEAWTNLRATTELFRKVLQEGQAAGEVRQDIDIHIVSDLYFGGLRHLVAWWLVRQQTWSLVSRADTITDTIFNAIKTLSERDTPFVCPSAETVKSSVPLPGKTASDHKNVAEVSDVEKNNRILRSTS